MQTFKIGQIIYGTYSPDCANFCNKNGAHLEKQDSPNLSYKIVKNTPLTKEEKDAILRAKYQELIDPITLQIIRLRDEDENNPKIKELIQKRNLALDEIKKELEE